jgi:hypothetical protein
VGLSQWGLKIFLSELDVRMLSENPFNTGLYGRSPRLSNDARPSPHLDELFMSSIYEVYHSLFVE